MKNAIEKAAAAAGGVFWGQSRSHTGATTITVIPQITDCQVKQAKKKRTNDRNLRKLLSSACDEIVVALVLHVLYVHLTPFDERAMKCRRMEIDQRSLLLMIDF